jgi:hypothetical protein
VWLEEHVSFVDMVLFPEDINPQGTYFKNQPHNYLGAKEQQGVKMEKYEPSTTIDRGLGRLVLPRVVTTLLVKCQWMREAIRAMQAPSRDGTLPIESTFVRIFGGQRTNMGKDRAKPLPS